MDEQVILVDKNDVQVGLMDKLEAHQKGVLHRAFSVFIFNSKMELLLQKRANGKYHSGNLWTNTCCSHPRPGESVILAAQRRLKEEMGIECPIEYVFHFIYTAILDEGMIEKEFDHVYIGWSDQPPKINTAEVDDWKYICLALIRQKIKESPDDFTEWFKICFEKMAHISNYLRENILQEEGS